MNFNISELVYFKYWAFFVENKIQEISRDPTISNKINTSGTRQFIFLAKRKTRFCVERKLRRSTTEEYSQSYDYGGRRTVATKSQNAKWKFDI